MSVEKGQLSIHTENFLPIIKKWLYSDRDIFVRELVSNCCDAVAKRRMTGETPEDYSPRVTVRVDKEHRILSFTDDGVGMTAEEVRKYINQVPSPVQTTSWRSTRTAGSRSSATSAWAFTPPSWSPTRSASTPSPACRAKRP